MSKKCELCANAVFEPFLKHDEILCRKTSKIEKDNFSCSYFKDCNKYHHDGCFCQLCVIDRQATKETE